MYQRHAEPAEVRHRHLRPAKSISAAWDAARDLLQDEEVSENVHSKHDYKDIDMLKATGFAQLM